MPEGSKALAGIGCHFMASWMDRETSSLIQMGGEGVNWAASSRFTGHKHIFQNLGEGTYYHSGSMAIRQAIAASANITYKILFNDGGGHDRRPAGRRPCQRARDRAQRPRRRRGAHRAGVG